MTDLRYTLIGVGVTKMYSQINISSRGWRNESYLVTPEDQLRVGSITLPSLSTGFLMLKAARTLAIVRKSAICASSTPGHCLMWETLPCQSFTGPCSIVLSYLRPNPNAKLALSGAFSGGRNRSGRNSSGFVYIVSSCNAALGRSRRSVTALFTYNLPDIGN